MIGSVVTQEEETNSLWNHKTGNNLNVSSFLCSILTHVESLNNSDMVTLSIFAAATQVGIKKKIPITMVCYSIWSPFFYKLK